MAHRYAGACNYVRNLNRQLVANSNGERDPSKRLERLGEAAVWENYWAKYYSQVLDRQRKCSMKQLVSGGDGGGGGGNGQSSNPIELKKIFVKQRNQVLVILGKWYDSDNQHHNDLWLPIINQTIQDYKTDFANIDKVVAKLKPKPIKVKTLQNVINEIEIVRHGMESMV
ncbi:uncharacterized protein LOC128953308 [Oppia nitens]|uniref:uncharacterized protein LOC128953308 n=1 Tax=Oppia nitens TaxID=1686743 RepID=UPI0023D97E7A|nr:uncharacterized protein LOC128953308 [Oppia nitens]